MKKLAIDCLLIALASLFLSPLAFGQCACGTDCNCPAGVCPDCPTQPVAIGGHWGTRCDGMNCSWVWVQAAAPAFPVAKIPDAMAPKKLPAGDGPPALAFPMQTAEPPRVRFSRLIHIRGFFHRLTHPRSCG